MKSRMRENRVSGSVRGWRTTDTWSKYCGTAGKPGGNGENKPRLVASGETSLLDSLDLYVGTAVIFFSVVNLLKFIPYQALGLLRVGNLTTVMILGPLTYVGVRLGIYLYWRFTDLWFNRTVYAILVFTGLQLVSGKNIITMLFR